MNLITLYLCQYWWQTFFFFFPISPPEKKAFEQCGSVGGGGGQGLWRYAWNQLDVIFKKFLFLFQLLNLYQCTTTGGCNDLARFKMTLSTLYIINTKIFIKTKSFLTTHIFG